MIRCLALLLLLASCQSVTKYDNLMGPACRVASASGVVVMSDESGSLVLTCDHVVAGQLDPITVKWEGGEAEGRVVRRDPEKDLALVFIPVQRPVIAMAEREPEPLDKIWMVGCPGGMDLPAPFKGYVGDDRRELGGIDSLLWIGNGAFYGSSGSGVLNEDRELVGIQSRARRAGFDMFQAAGYAVPLEDIRQFMKEFEDERKSSEEAEEGAGGDGDQPPPAGVEEAEEGVDANAEAGAPVL